MFESGHYANLYMVTHSRPLLAAILFRRDLEVRISFWSGRTPAVRSCALGATGAAVYTCAALILWRHWVVGRYGLPADDTI